MRPSVTFCDPRCLTAAHPNGALLIPLFRRGTRAELLTDLVYLMETGASKMPDHHRFTACDSASEIFRRHARELENSDALVRGIESKNVRFNRNDGAIQGGRSHQGFPYCHQLRAECVRPGAFGIA